MNSSYQAVICDMDGVITDTMPYHFRAWQRIFADNGVTVTREQVYAREGQRGIHSILEIFAEQGKPVSGERARRILTDKERLFKKIVRQRFILGARSFVKDLSRTGYRLALVTGTSGHEVKKVLPPDIFCCFDVVVSGSDVVKGKPHPEPYLKAVRALKIPKADALVIENAPYGITSAKKAGLTCLALATSLPVQYLKDADRIFPDYRHLKGYFHARISLKRS